MEEIVTIAKGGWKYSFVYHCLLSRSIVQKGVDENGVLLGQVVVVVSSKRGWKGHLLAGENSIAVGHQIQDCLANLNQIEEENRYVQIVILCHLLRKKAYRIYAIIICK